MRFSTTIQCLDENVVVEILPDSSLVFHDYNLDADTNAESLGFDKTECIELYENYYSSPIKTIVKEFPLTGKSWAAIFVKLLKDKAFLYTDMMKMIDDLSVDNGKLTHLPLQMLDIIERAVTEGLRKSRSEMVKEWKKSANDINTLCLNETYLEDTYEDSISSLIGATEAWIKAVRNLYIWFTNNKFDSKLLSGKVSAPTRELIIDNIVEASWLVCFFKVKKSFPLKYKNQALFDEALEMQYERLEEMIQTMVSVVHAIKRG